jgi:hypothetical protein
LIAPDFDGREPSEAIEYIGHAILRNFWPKMIDLPDSSASMEFHLSWAGQKFDVPRPSDLPPLDAFVRAYQNAREYLSGRAAPHSPSWLQDVRSQRPAKLLGTISLVRFPVAPRVEPHDEPESSSASPFEGPSQHVALMRGPRFVVEYKRGPAIAYELAEYAGVFVASDEAEEAFAKSEPPTHDDWSPDMLDARLDRTLVRVALSRIRDAMQEFTGAPSVPRTEAVDVTLGGFSDMLGGLMPAEAGTGARGLAGGSRANRGPSLGSGSGAESSARVRVLQTELVSAGAGVHPVCRILFDLGDDRRRSETEVIARAATLLDDGSLEVDPPLGMEIPQVLEWSDLHGTIATSGEGISIDARSTGPWTVTVSVPSDAAIGVELNARVAGS